MFGIELDPAAPRLDGKRVHALKTWPEYFAEVLAGTKPFEIRRDDRGYRVDDVLILREWEPTSGEYSGRECMRRVTYITEFEQLPGNVVLGLAAFEK
jgi:hypothetical protein